MTPETFQKVIHNTGKMILGVDFDFSSFQIDGIVHATGKRSIKYSGRIFGKNKGNGYMVLYGESPDANLVPRLLEEDYQAQMNTKKKEEQELKEKEEIVDDRTRQ